jgi:hypothetical protein
VPVALSACLDLQRGYGEVTLTGERAHPGVPLDADPRGPWCLIGRKLFVCLVPDGWVTLISQAFGAWGHLSLGGT